VLSQPEFRDESRHDCRDQEWWHLCRRWLPPLPRQAVPLRLFLRLPLPDVEYVGPQAFSPGLYCTDHKPMQIRATVSSVMADGHSSYDMYCDTLRIQRNRY
jgi:hypothetical protein